MSWPLWLTHRHCPRPTRRSVELALAGLVLATICCMAPAVTLAAPEPTIESSVPLARAQTRDIEGGIRGLFAMISTTGVNVVGAVFTAVAVVGGLLIITAGSNSRRSETGQAFLWSGVIGVFIVLMASTFSEELIRLFGGA